MNFEQMPPAEGGAAPEPPTVPEGTTPTTTETGIEPIPAVAQPEAGVNENDRLMAAAAYATQVILPVVVPAIMLLSEENKRRPFQKYHAIQSLGFLVAAVIYEVLAVIVFIGLSIVSLGCLSCILWVLFLLPVVPAFYYAYRAYQGQYFDIPMVTDFLVQSKWLEKPSA
jgi:uncharacterized membrane protein